MQVAYSTNRSHLLIREIILLTSENKTHAGLRTDSGMLDYFEETMRDFMARRLSDTKNWWKACVPQEIRTHAEKRHKDAEKMSDVLNKPVYDVWHYLNFDGYGRIITKKDNWKSYFESIFVERAVFEYKMRVILSLRNDVRHGRDLDHINNLRLRLHCYDILSQIYEKDSSLQYDKDGLIANIGLD